MKSFIDTVIFGLIAKYINVFGIISTMQYVSLRRLKNETILQSNASDA